MKIGELEVSFEPYELPEDYKFVNKIKCCEHKIDFGANTIVDKILSTRTKIVDEEVIRQLKNIGEEKGINELILIDESKVLKIIKSLKALEIIKKKNVFVWGFIHRKEEIKDLEHTYDYYKTHYGYFHSGYTFELLTEEEFNLLKEVLL